MSDNERNDRPRWRSSNDAPAVPPTPADTVPSRGVDLQKPPTEADRYSRWLSVPAQADAAPEPTPRPETHPAVSEPVQEPARAVEPEPAAAPAAVPMPEVGRGTAETRTTPVERALEHERYAEPVRPRLAGVDPREPVRSGGGGRGLLIGGAAAAVLLAVLAGWALTRDRDAPGAVVETVPPREAPPEGASVRTQAAYAAPDREAVRDAYGEVGRIYSTAGVSGLAEAGRSCFANLAEAPSYRGLDYCGALDAYGAAFATRVSGSPAAPESWFGQAESRFLRAAEPVMGPERDGAARLVDIRRLAIEVAKEGGPAQAAAGGAQPSAPARTDVPPSLDAPGSVRVTTVEPSVPASPAPVRQAEPRPAPAARPVERTPTTPPLRQAPDREAYAAARPTNSGPTAAEVAAARPRQGRGPSFNCRYARSSSERLVCDDAELAALDRRLNAAFEDAIASGVPRRQLRLEQDGWLAQREAAAPDRDAVRDAYQRRIRELNALQ